MFAQLIENYTPQLNRDLSALLLRIECHERRLAGDWYKPQVEDILKIGQL